MEVRRDSWRIIETILRRYPERKKEYNEYISDIMSCTGSSTNKNPEEEDNKPQSVTEGAALKMTSAYADRIKKEIEAVEFVLGNLSPAEQKVISVRYWTKGIRKPIPYYKMPECSYSERSMKRITFKVIKQIGRYLGEIK